MKNTQERLNTQALGHEYLQEILHLMKECKTELDKEGIYQWTEKSPSANIISQDLLNEQVYGYFEKKALAGVITLNSFQSPVYEEIDWTDSLGKCLVVHRLAILPIYQKRGLANTLMDFAES